LLKFKSLLLCFKEVDKFNSWQAKGTIVTFLLGYAIKAARGEIK